MSVYVPPESLLDSKAFRRLLAISLAGHVAVFAAFTLRPRGRAELISPSPVMVNVVQAPLPQAQPAAPKSVPKAVPKPPPKPPEPEPEPEPPPPPKPVVNEIVIPKEVAPLKPPKPKAKPAPKPAPKPKTAEQLLAELTQKVEAEHPDSVPEAPPEAPPTDVQAPIAGGAGTFDPLLSPWVARVESVVRTNWSGAQLCKGTPKFNVDVGSGGELSDIELAESSGDRYCDEAAERALRKSDPLPAPPGGAISVVLRLSQGSNM